MDFRASLDTGSIQEVIRLQGFSALLDPEIRDALVKGGTRIAQRAQQNAYDVFENNSPGGLADNIYPWLVSPTEMEIRVDKPYAHRREGLDDQGQPAPFHGPDALDRMFPNEISRPYLRPAMEQETPDVEALFAAAANNALGRIVA